MSNSQVAETILEQLSGGAGRLVAMTGARDMVYDSNSLAFKFPMRDRKRPNYCRIELAADDTYSVTFGRIVKFELRNAETLSGVYAESLAGLFESKTGLYLSL